MTDELPPHEQACSFCRKTRLEVLKLVAGPGVSICDECVQLCQEILVEDATPPPVATLRSPGWLPRLFGKK